MRTVRLTSIAALSAVTLAVATTSATAKTIVGTPGPERISATASNDKLYGLGGADTFMLGNHSVQVYGMRSGNKIRGGNGHNYIEGGNGNDDIVLGNGNNTVLGGTGHDTITVGDGHNFIDDGGASGKITVGNGNNVIYTGSGGGSFRAGNGNNTVIFGSGKATIELGSGVNHVWINTDSAVGTVNCGGNPESTLYMQHEGASGHIMNRKALREGRIVGCPNVQMVAPVTEPNQGIFKIARNYQKYNFTGTSSRNDTLLGSHGSGRINGRGGNNVIWADHIPAVGGKKTRQGTSRITAGGGNNHIYGGRGSNFITVGGGDNFIRGGDRNNTIVTKGGDNLVGLQGRGVNNITFNGGKNHVDSFANGPKPTIRCVNGAKATVVYGRVKPKTNCKNLASAYSRKGQLLSINGLQSITLSGHGAAHEPKPGDNGIGVSRPEWTAHR